MAQSLEHELMFGADGTARRVAPSVDLPRKSGEAFSDHVASLSNCAGLK